MDPRRLIVCCSILCSLLLAAPLLHSQAPTATPPGGNPVPWAAIAIHPSDPGRNKANDTWGDQPNGITGQGMGLRELLSQAYNFSFLPFRDEEMVGLPGWAKDARYDVRARVDPDDVESFRKLSSMTMAEALTAFGARQYTGEMLMCQAMLADRFHLKAHYELRPHAVYLLTVDKAGPHLKPTSNGGNEGSLQFSNGKLSGKGVALYLIANLLAYPAERYVLDRTSLQGRYDFDLHFAPNNAGVASEPSTDPDFFTAVREELGLRLESGHADVPVLVIDQIEEPTPN